LWKISGNILENFGYGSEYEIIHSLVFLGLSMVYETVLHLPFGLYHTFVIEEKHGFNKQTLGSYLLDQIKMMLVGVVLGVPAISALIQIIKWGGPQFYIYVWLFLLAFSLFVLTLYPTLIAPLFNKFTPLEEGELKTNIEKLASSINYPLYRLLEMDGSKRSGHSNAYFFGFWKHKRIVLYDTLKKQLTTDEIVAVLAHELGHWSLNHVAKNLFIAQIQIFVSFFLFGQVLQWTEMYTSFGFDTKPTIIGILLFFQFLMSPVDNVLSFLMHMLSRSFEFQADAFALKLGFSETLRSALLKLDAENLSNKNPDRWYSTYHHSHPPLMERLKALEKSK